MARLGAGKGRRALLVVASLVIVALGVGAVAAFLAWPRGSEEAAVPRVTASVEMNGGTWGVEEGGVVNKAPVFASRDVEERGCAVESRVSCDGVGTGWVEGLGVARAVEGECLFEFRRVCGRSVSAATAFRLVVDPSLPDVRVGGGAAGTCEWVGLAFELPEGGEAGGVAWSVGSDSTGSPAPLVDREGRRFATRAPGTFVVRVTSPRGNSSALTVPVGRAAQLGGASGTLAVPGSVAILSGELLERVAAEGTVT